MSLTRIIIATAALSLAVLPACNDEDGDKAHEHSDSVHADEHSTKPDVSADSDAGGYAEPDIDAGASAEGESTAKADRYALCSVVINADGDRTTYVQSVASLEAGPYDNRSAIEIAGNGVVMGLGKYFFVGKVEEPTWVRYELDDKNQLKETGRLSLLDQGVTAIDYGNTIVDEETAVSVFTKQFRAVIWNPTTMQITGEVDLEFLKRDTYELEVWTTTAHNGLVYIPGRWANWDDGRVLPGVSTTIVDPKQLKVLGTATSDRCTSGGRVVFGKDGYGYVMGDGRNYSINMFALAKGDTKVVDGCLLRIAPGETKYDENFFVTIPSLTDGHNPISELDTAGQDVGIGFAKIFYPEDLPENVKPVDFDFWDLPVHRLWAFDLSSTPTAAVVEGFPKATLGFGGSAIDGKMYMANNPDGDSTRSDVYEIDPVSKKATLKFRMAGYFDGIYKLTH